MKFYIVNGSPRKNYNTGQLLDKTVEGIKDTLKSQVPDEEIEIERMIYILLIILDVNPASYVNKKTVHFMQHVR